MAGVLSVQSDEYFMRMALREAQKAYEAGEVPVGAVVVGRGILLAKAHNQTEILTDVTAHAEILAITAASNSLGGKYLEDCTLYVTLEPCPMCAGALYWARPSRVVYAAEDAKRGFMRYGKSLLHPKTKVEYGVLEQESRLLLQSFFAQKRHSSKAQSSRSC